MWSSKNTYDGTKFVFSITLIKQNVSLNLFRWYCRSDIWSSKNWNRFPLYSLSSLIKLHVLQFSISYDIPIRFAVIFLDNWKCCGVGLNFSHSNFYSQWISRRLSPRRNFHFSVFNQQISSGTSYRFFHLRIR